MTDLDALARLARSRVMAEVEADSIRQLIDELRRKLYEAEHRIVGLREQEDRLWRGEVPDVRTD